MNETDSRYNKTVPAIEEALAAGSPIWEQLGGFLPASDDADGAAGNHEKIYRAEAAYNLIVNHEAVFRDLVNPSPSHNIYQNPLTQAELKRVPSDHAKFADAFLREVARRLLGRKPGIEQLAEQPHKSWAVAAMYVIARVHSTTEEKPGRSPDMGVKAGMAFKAVMNELGNMALAL